MPHYVGLDVSQKTTAICVVDEQGRRLWRGACVTDPGAISARVLRHAGVVDVKVGVETGSMTPWLVHGLRSAGLDVQCLDARRVKAALQMRLNKTDENDAEGLAQVLRTGWYRPVHVKSFDAHRARALLGARAQLVGMTTRLSNMIRGVLKTFGLLPGAGRGLRFDRSVETLLEGAPEIGLIVRPLLATWRQLREQIAVFDKAVQQRVRADPICRLLMTVPGIGALSSLVYVSTVEDPRPIFSISSGGCAPRSHATSLPIRRDRSQRTHLPVWRRSRAHAHVRGRGSDPLSHQAIAAPEGLGRSHRAALRPRQGACSLGSQVVGYPAQRLAVRGAVPLDTAYDSSVAHRNSSAAYGQACRPWARVQAIARSGPWARDQA